MTRPPRNTTPPGSRRPHAPPTHQDAPADSTTQPGGNPWGPHGSTLSLAEVEPDNPSAKTLCVDRHEATPGPLFEPKASDRYVDLGLIGEGGMGEVHRVLDRELNRTMAMKILRPELAVSESSVARFIEEAQATAQLQHPSIVPVHELGRLPDGRFYFTMVEVRGRTFDEIISELHDAAAGGQWMTTESGWTFRSTVTAFHKACTAVAYAHSRGVVHRDLKPSNIMVGEFGEVLVMDWGLAKVLHAPGAPGDEVETTVVTCRSMDSGSATHAGAIAGTPAYMAPEQARGETSRVGPRTDVYALGAILYRLLTGSTPYSGTGVQVIEQVRRQSPLPPSAMLAKSWTRRHPSPAKTPGARRATLEDAALPPPIPDELEEICVKAMRRDPADRYPDANSMAREVVAWLENARRRERALNLVRKARQHLPDIDRLRSKARTLRARAQQVLARIEPYHPVTSKEPGWKLEDEAARLDLEASLIEVRYLQTLQAALTVQADLPEALDALATHYHHVHQAAERARDTEAARKAELQLRWYDRGRYATYLKGDGTLTLHTRPQGAEVRLYAYRPHGRRLVPTFVEILGETPIVERRLPRGRYLLTLSKPGFETVRYPIDIQRGQHWDGVRPGDRDPFPVPLPSQGALAPGECYVPPGWFEAGGDEEAFNSAPATRLWVDGFVIQTFPVTNRDYLEHLNELIAEGRTDRATALAPSERGSTTGAPGAIIYGRDSEGRFVLRPDADGDVWLPDWPVVMIDRHSAAAYAEDMAARSGLPWRLPSEWEWEKAARGVDGRAFPWGDFADPTWARISHSEAGRPCPARVHEYPVDESPYGVRGMAGNVREWCIERFHAPLPDPSRPLVVTPADPGPETLCVSRGGSWIGTLRTLRAACRNAFLPMVRYGDFGLRLVRPLIP